MNDLLRHLLGTDPVSPYTHEMARGEAREGIPVPTSLRIEMNPDKLVKVTVGFRGKFSARRIAKLFGIPLRLVSRSVKPGRRHRRGATGGKRWRR